VTREIELTELLGGIHRKIMRRISRFAVEEGLSVTEGMVLWKIHKRGISRVSEISTQIGLPPSTLTGILDRLVAGGWLTREDDPEDRRAVLMKSTPKLAEFTRNSMRRSSRDLEKSFKDLAPDVIDRLVADLKSVLGCLEDDEEKKT